jgi:hypothetical protein
MQMMHSRDCMHWAALHTGHFKISDQLAVSKDTAWCIVFEAGGCIA